MGVQGRQETYKTLLTPVLRDEINRLVDAGATQGQIVRKTGIHRATIGSWMREGKTKRCPASAVPGRRPQPASDVMNGRLVKGPEALMDVWVSNDLAWLMARIDLYKNYGLTQTREYVLWRERATELLMARAEREMEAA
jgi:hypothetical protein